ncbi:MAG: hypothetical protein J7K00_05300 [Candidatus Diapherotrites archaeon]|nr:hypothetical protein [Candidatus Diapherotrites archaeon]
MKGKQEKLKKLYQAQQQGNWLEIQQVQEQLKDCFKESYEEGFQKLLLEKPGIRPFFDMDSELPQSRTITPEIADYYNVNLIFREFISKAKFSTAGIRGFTDVLHSENPDKIYNDLFMAILIEAEAEFLKEMHGRIKSRLDKIRDIDRHCLMLKKEIGEENTAIIEKIYGMELKDILHFLKHNIVKLVGGEVRVHTAKFCEMEARILAEKGITVIAMKSYSDSTAIYIYSLLTFMLGACGATYYTSSHSSSYLFGRKYLSPDGGQLLPEEYDPYIKILDRIINKEIYGQGKYTISMSAADNSNIKKNLDYKEMSKLFLPVLNVTEKDVQVINNATEEGQKIILNCLNGSTWKTLKPILDELKIDTGVFDLVWQEENAFFNAGYSVIYDRDTGKFIVDHFGIDTTWNKCINTIPYCSILKDQPVGKMVFECDPDSDRFVLKQVMSEEQIPLLEEFGVEHIKLQEGKVLGMPSPNKVFLALDIIDKEKLEAQGLWEKYISLYFITYVSTRAWSEFADSVPHLVRVMEMVGFKNLTAMQRVFENWWFDSDKEKLVFKDQLGREIALDRALPVRIHSKEEESGGRVAGTAKVCVNILGQRTLAMPEKSSVDALVSMLIFASEQYLAGKNDLENSDYIMMNFLKAKFKKYSLKSKIDMRLDILHGSQGIIAMLPYKEQQKALKEAQAKKDNFNNFAFSLGKAVREKEKTIDEVIEMLIAAAPEYKETWRCLDEITVTEEEVAGGETRFEGTPMIFRPKNGLNPLFTELDFRPSGTDPLKSKVYVDAESLSFEQRKKTEKYFDNLAGRDLYHILAHFKVKSAVPKSDSTGKQKQ